MSEPPNSSLSEKIKKLVIDKIYGIVVVSILSFLMYELTPVIVDGYIIPKIQSKFEFAQKDSVSKALREIEVAKDSIMVFREKYKPYFDEQLNMIDIGRKVDSGELIFLSEDGRYYNVIKSDTIEYGWYIDSRGKTHWAY